MFVCKSWEELNKQNRILTGNLKEAEELNEYLRDELNKTKLKLVEYQEKYTAQI
jgi:hypothetical protein